MTTSDSATLDLRPLLAVMGMAAVFGVLQGLSYPLFALLLERAGHSASLIGINAAMLPLGLLVTAPFVPALARRVGARRLAVAACLLLALALTAMGSTSQLWVWFVGRFLVGVGINIIYVISETWLNLMIPRHQRGRWLAIYATLLGAGFAAGPVLLLATGSDGFAPFLAAILISLTTGALIVVASPLLPRFTVEGAKSLWRFLPLAPLLLLAVGAAAAFDQATLTFVPLYVLAYGATEDAAKLAITALTLGNVLLQLPIGWLADRVSRRAAFLTCTVTTVAGATLLPLLTTAGPLLWLMLFVWGAAAYGSYTVSLVELGDRFSGGLLLAGNAAFAFMWGAAGLVGPATTGVAMDAFGPIGLPLVVGVVFVIVTLALWRPRPELDSARPLA
ncbi:MAG: MFS transporter [Pseudomonadota bacterium]